ncbi:M48 family metallopeptidase [Sphingomonas colocasiae]|uniref:M48 family metallopeptidase n=1 Tax=Sphingomonas colocasiae TaxID=1848973 RepID=UPI001FE4C416|nr:M48 family metallopeptidase [Sphingomonas colocasiae]
MWARSEVSDGVPVWHYDGVTARRRHPLLVTDAAGFRLIEDEVESGPFGWDALVAQAGAANERVYGLKSQPGWRIGFTGGVPAEIDVLLPHPERYGRLIDRFGLVRASAVLAVIAGFVVFIGVTAPGWIAPYVPSSWEKRLGDAMVGDFGGRFCKGAGGQQALDALARQLDHGGDPIEVRVANIKMVNAVALPGGKVVIFRELLSDAKSPDEVAGVLGHEIGHVRNRDVMAALLRQMGLSVLLGGFSGDVGGTFNALLSATYSREAEANADNYAISALSRAGISPAATAGFFARLARDEAKLGPARAALGYMSSHPLSESRERKFKAGVAASARYRPALDAAQWRALSDICKNDPEAEEGWFPG